MKKVDSWNEEEQSEFIYLFAKARMINVAMVGGTAFTFPRKEEAFFEVKTFMEKECPKLWEEYLDETEFMASATERLNHQLDPHNLVSFLLESEQVEEWGWVECPDCEKHTVMKWPIYCRRCHKGQKHSALLYAEGLK